MSNNTTNFIDYWQPPTQQVVNMTETQYLSEVFNSAFNVVMLFSTISFIVYVYVTLKYINVTKLSKQHLNMRTIMDFFMMLNYIFIFIAFAVYSNSFLAVYPLGIVMIFTIIIICRNFLEIFKRTKSLSFW